MYSSGVASLALHPQDSHLFFGYVHLVDELLCFGLRYSFRAVGEAHEVIGDKRYALDVRLQVDRLGLRFSPLGLECLVLATTQRPKHVRRKTQAVRRRPEGPEIEPILLALD
jgi:hypothetical protein